jgi:hypothetical protein
VGHVKPFLTWPRRWTRHQTNIAAGPRRASGIELPAWKYGIAVPIEPSGLDLEC